MGFGETTSEELERIASAVVDSAFRVHTRLGPGLLESAYRAIMTHELRKRGFEVSCEVPVPIVYDEVKLDVGYRLDLLVNGCVVIEVKAVEKFNPIHEAQLLTYLKLTGIRLGFLINFHQKLIKDGIKRMVL
jgi:GxxExxY protein